MITDKNFECDENDLEGFDDFVDYYGFNNKEDEELAELDFNDRFYNIEDDDLESFENGLDNDKKE
jgi:hypothetical protein